MRVLRVVNERTACRSSQSSAKCAPYGESGHAHHSRRLGHQSRRSEQKRRKWRRNTSRAFTDGRDASPTGGAHDLQVCENELKQSGAKIMTIVGRYFAMDRDRRWDRTKKAWDAIVFGRGEVCKSSSADALARQYELGKTDEFMPPLIFANANEQRIRDDDTVLFFNFRADRARQLSQAFVLKNFNGFDRESWPRVHYVTLTQYDVTYPSPFIFAPEKLVQILGEVVSAASKSQLRVAETEKYPHVTYFFNGGIERAFPK